MKTEKDEAFAVACQCRRCSVWRLKDGMILELSGGGYLGIFWDKAIELLRAGKLREYIETENAISTITGAAKGIADAENGSQGSNSGGL